MQNIPIMFKLERRTIIPVLTVTGIANSIPGIDKFMVAKAAEIIEKLQKYDGKPVIVSEKEKTIDGIPRGATAVRFNMIFKNEEDYQKAIEGLQRELG